MFMNFRFSRGYGKCQAIQAIVMCCYSNTYSAEVLLGQQWATAPSTGHMPNNNGGR
jgi:hypothetical protein